MYNLTLSTFHLVPTLVFRKCLKLHLSSLSSTILFKLSLFNHPHYYMLIINRYSNKINNHNRS